MNFKKWAIQSQSQVKAEQVRPRCRRTIRKADTLLVVSDATPKNLLLVNRYNQDIEKEKLKDLELDYLGNIPEDMEIEKLSLNGSSLLSLKEEAISIIALRNLGDKIWGLN